MYFDCFSQSGVPFFVYTACHGPLETSAGSTRLPVAERAEISSSISWRSNSRISSPCKSSLLRFPDISAADEESAALAAAACAWACKPDAVAWKILRTRSSGEDDTSDMRSANEPVAEVNR